MILYANGCSHTAAAEAVIPAAFAKDDGRAGIDRRPHPINLAASWCTVLAKKLGMDLVCDAESASSNDRILRTTKDWIKKNSNLVANTLFVIQWTTWEREEWLHNDVYYQVNASGVDYVPPELRQRYQQYVVSVDYTKKTQEWYEKIWQFHVWLRNQQIKHVMYNGWSTFSDMPDRRDWNRQYIGPYDRELSYNSVLKNNSFEWATPGHFHFRADGHCFWANFLLQYINSNQILNSNNEISLD
jgi:hypothetical protein